MPTSWACLLPELKERIASLLSGNEVACTLRLVDKATAALFNGPKHTTIRLSQPSPPDAFARQWRAPDATRTLTLKQRRRLLCLTAASGSVPNLEVALAIAGCSLAPDVFRSAAEARQPQVCAWLLQRGCPAGGALAAAAAADHRDMCEWLLAHVHTHTDELYDPYHLYDAAAAAAWGGHIGLMDWLLQLLRQQQEGERAAHAGGVGDGGVVGGGGGPVPPPAAPEAWRGRNAWAAAGRLEALLANAARGCDLATLQRLCAEVVAAQAAGEEPQLQPPPQLWPEGPHDLGGEPAQAQGWLNSALESAAASPTPDWRIKLEWLEAMGRGGGDGDERRSRKAAAAAAVLPDAVERLAWLRRRGYPLVAEAAVAAARAGNEAALRLLYDSGGGSGRLRAAAYAAAKAGQVGALRFLWAEAGVSVDGVAVVAAEGGHLHVLQWLAAEGGAGEERGLAGELDARLLAAAARSGSVELLAWLRQRGCGWGEEAVRAAAAAGSSAALEWLAERGCPMPDDGGPYLTAVSAGDAATLRCLARLGCPWGPAGRVFGSALACGAEPPLLTCLLEEGCPVDWDAADAEAEAEAARVVRPDRAALLALLEEWRR